MIPRFIEPWEHHVTCSSPLYGVPQTLSFARTRGVKWLLAHPGDLKKTYQRNKDRRRCILEGTEQSRESSEGVVGDTLYLGKHLVRLVPGRDASHASLQHRSTRSRCSRCQRRTSLQIPSVLFREVTCMLYFMTNLYARFAGASRWDTISLEINTFKTAT